MRSSHLGKKIFFVYPHSVITKDLIDCLINLEYEVYLLNDHREIENICQEYIEPIFLINIDKVLKGYEWEDYIGYLVNNGDTKHARIGALTFNQNDRLAKRYLMDIGITCGFVKLKLNVRESKDIILKMLKVNDVKEKRSYLATSCYRNDAYFNVNLIDSIEHGDILSISSIGMIFTFDNNKIYNRGTYRDVQLKLKGKLIKVSLDIIDIKNDIWKNPVYIGRFSNNTDEISKFKIKSYISRTLQCKVEKKLNLSFLRFAN